MIKLGDHINWYNQPVNKSVNKFVNNMEITVNIDTYKSYSQLSSSYSQPYIQGLNHLNLGKMGRVRFVDILTAPYNYLLIQITILLFYVFIEELAWN
jgi:hypothetical protein